MRALIQRVSEAAVAVEGQIVGQIGPGLLVFVGIEEADGEEDIQYLCKKITNLRIFNDAAGVMNCSLIETGGAILAISQFTLHASTKKGNRPSYIRAAKPDVAVPLYERFVAQLGEHLGQPVQTGRFGADMQVRLLNDGPVTIWMDSRQKE